MYLLVAHVNLFSTLFCEKKHFFHITEMEIFHNFVPFFHLKDCFPSPFSYISEELGNWLARKHTHNSYMQTINSYVHALSTESIPIYK